MLIMAIDHVRDFFHRPAMVSNPLDLLTTTPAIFFTRWITHFCAPIFVFLSGVSAFISGQRKTKAALSRFLITRGLWLVFVEVAIITLAITFNPRYNFFVFQVIWAIGWSMVILGLLVRTSYKIIAIAGLLLVFGHNLLDYANLPSTGPAADTWRMLFTSSGYFLPLGGGRGALVIYTILPWTGIMLLGYAFGAIYRNGFDVQKRRRILLYAGAGAILLFIVLRTINQYGDPSPWTEQRKAFFSFLSFINVTKYPVSLQYTCMTVGVAILFLALTENINNRFTAFLSIYGRVPFFYYVLHFFLIHLICVLFFFAAGYNMSQATDPNSPFLFRPVQFGYPLWVVYAVWLSAVLSLYYPCRWFNRYKQGHREWWVSYL